MRVTEDHKVCAGIGTKLDQGKDWGRHKIIRFQDEGLDADTWNGKGGTYTPYQILKTTSCKHVRFLPECCHGDNCVPESSGNAVELGTWGIFLRIEHNGCENYNCHA